MPVLKKVIYVYLTFILLAWLILPFAAYAESFGTVDLTEGQATVTQIKPGQEYGFRLAVNEHPNTGFYFNNITQIDVYKTETSTSYSSGSQLLTSVAAQSSVDIDVKSRFENSTKVIVSDPSVTRVQLSATVSYVANYPNGVSYPDSGQTKIFTTSPTSYTIIVPPVNNDNTGTNTTNTNPNTGTTTNTTTTTTTTSQPTVSGLSAFIFGAACSDKTIIVSCYIEKVIRLFIAIASIGSVLMIIFGGILLITSAGDPKKITTGRMAVTGAIIGLVIVLLSYSILQFVQKTVTGEVSGSTTTTNNGSNGLAPTPLPNSNSVSNTYTFAASNGSTITYNRTSTKSSTSSVEDNGIACNTAMIGGTAINCADIRVAFKTPEGPYPDANFYGEQDSSASKTYYLQGINIDSSNGNATVYYKTTQGSSDIFYDTWTAQ